MLAAKHRYRQSKADTFRETFQRELKPYLDPITGFDLIQFDLDIGTPDNISTADWIEQKWGYEAVQIIRELIS